MIYQSMDGYFDSVEKMEDYQMYSFQISMQEQKEHMAFQWSQV
ncbi:hypothetical protein [Clostridium algoriphilum]|nr:hypothetical protein [Clostridium algoriphilum]